MKVLFYLEYYKFHMQTQVFTALYNHLFAYIYFLVSIINALFNRLGGFYRTEKSLRNLQLFFTLRCTIRKGIIISTTLIFLNAFNLDFCKHNCIFFYRTKSVLYVSLCWKLLTLIYSYFLYFKTCLFLI